MKVDLDSSDLLSIKHSLKKQMREIIKNDKQFKDDNRNWLDYRKLQARLYSNIYHAHKSYWHKSGS